MPFTSGTVATTALSARNTMLPVATGGVTVTLIVASSRVHGFADAAIVTVVG